MSSDGRAHYAPRLTRVVGDGPAIGEIRPESCPDGHSLAGRGCQVAYGIAPDGERRRSWRCLNCDTITWES